MEQGNDSTRKCLLMTLKLTSGNSVHAHGLQIIEKNVDVNFQGYLSANTNTLVENVE